MKSVLDYCCHYKLDKNGCSLETVSMQLLMSQLPDSDWWGKGTPVYENNWSMELGRIPKAAVTRNEYRNIVKTVQKYTDLTIIPFPKKLDPSKHDAVFVRDSFISNQQGTIVMSHYTERARQEETDHLRTYLKKQNFTVHELSWDAHAEGGEFYFLKKQNLLIAGSARNNKKGVIETAHYLNTNELFIIESPAYHVDTVATVLLSATGFLTGIIACLRLIKNKTALKAFAKKHTVPVIDIEPKDAITQDGKGRLVVNCLPLPGILIGGGTFITPGVEEKIAALGINHVTTPATQFLLSGGGIHCLTNELFFGDKNT